MSILVQRVMEDRVPKLLEKLLVNPSLLNPPPMDEGGLILYLRLLAMAYEKTHELARDLHGVGCGDLDIEGNNMAATFGSNFQGDQEFVYRISTAQEWEELQRNGSTFGGDLDKSTACFHLSNLHQVQSTLQTFFLNVKAELYLLQVDAKKLGDGLVYEAVDESNVFPHFYGPSRSFSPLPLNAVTKAEKLTLLDGKFTCNMLK